MTQKSFDYKAEEMVHKEKVNFGRRNAYGLMSTLTIASFTPSLPFLIQSHPEGNPDDWQLTLETKVRNRSGGKEDKSERKIERREWRLPCLSEDWAEFNSLWTAGGSYRRTDLDMKPKCYLLFCYWFSFYYGLYDTDYCGIFFTFDLRSYIVSIFVKFYTCLKGTAFSNL